MDAKSESANGRSTAKLACFGGLSLDLSIESCPDHFAREIAGFDARFSDFKVRLFLQR